MQDQLGREKTAVVREWNRPLSRKTINGTIESKGGSRTLSAYPMGMSDPTSEEFNGFPAYGKPDLSFSHFVAM